MNNRYEKAISRGDLSQFVLHLTEDRHEWVPPAEGTSPSRVPLLSGGFVEMPAPSTLCTTPAKEVLYEILRSGEIRASTVSSITRYAPGGAACFYDVPRQHWPELADPEATGRRGYGILFAKPMIWHLGGRPVIYTEDSTPHGWPEKERFRLVATNLNRSGKLLDWTHEREWRIPGSLKLYGHTTDPWWWVCVKAQEDALEFFRGSPGDYHLYVLDLGGVVLRGQFGL